MRILSRKWDGSLHRDSYGYELGTDRHGTWLWMPDQTPVTTKNVTYLAPRGLRLISIGCDWSAYFVPASRDRPKQLYVDITTPAVRTDNLIEFVDLDLDVEQLDDGDVQILDEDVFAQHRQLFGYPAPIVERAVQRSRSIADCIARGLEPFATAHLAWLVAGERLTT